LIACISYTDRNAAFYWYAYAISYSKFDVSIQLIRAIEINKTTSIINIDAYIDNLQYDVEDMPAFALLEDAICLKQLIGEWRLTFHKKDKYSIGEPSKIIHDM